MTVLSRVTDPDFLDHCRLRGIRLDKVNLIDVADRSRQELIELARELCQSQSFSSVFIPYLDHLFPLLLEKPDYFSVPVRGIWFNPHALDTRYRWLPPLDKRLRMRRATHLGLRRLPSSEWIQHLYLLDPHSVNAMKAVNPLVPATFLPDPGESLPSMTQSEALEHLGLPGDRLVFLHAGSPEKRKGFPDLLGAFSRLIEDGHLPRKPLLIRVGPNDRLDSCHRRLLSRLEADGYVYCTNDFVSRADFMNYFSACDWVTLPYRNFRFSSGILANAILAQKPVVASDYGYIGRRVSGEQLGVVYKHGSCRSLTRVLKQIFFGKIKTPRVAVDSAYTADHFVQSLKKTF